MPVQTCLAHKMRQAARLHHANLAVPSEVKLITALVDALLDGALDLETIALSTDKAFTLLLQAVG